MRKENLTVQKKMKVSSSLSDVTIVVMDLKLIVRAEIFPSHPAGVAET
jgi:hypothetical protein